MSKNFIFEFITEYPKTESVKILFTVDFSIFTQFLNYLFKHLKNYKGKKWLFKYMKYLMLLGHNCITFESILVPEIVITYNI